MVLLQLVFLALLITSSDCRRLKKVAARVKEQKEQILQLTTALATLKEEQEEGEMKVLLEGEETDSSCYKTCVGDTGRGDTIWEDPGKDGKILTRVDITRCEFTSPPIITTALSGDGHHDKTIGVGAPFQLTKSGFIVNLLGETVTGFEDQRNPIDTDKADHYNWHIFWIAVGNTC